MDFFGILIILAIIAVVVWMMKPGANNTQSSQAPNKKTLETLNERFAKREISEEE